MFKYIELDKLGEDKVVKLIEFLDSQEESSKKMYLEYIPFNVSFIKNLLNKYNKDLKEVNDELNETKNNCEAKDTELKELKEELNKMKIEEKQMKEELEECKREKKQVKESTKIRKSDNKKYTQSIIVCGIDTHNGLGEKPNNQSQNGHPIISPQVKLSFDPSSLLSYSIYQDFSVLITSDGSLKGIGYNMDGRISSTLQKTIIDHFTDFSIKDDSGHQLSAVSAVCSSLNTLYIFSKISGSGRHLVLCDCDINGGDPIFLNIGNHYPVALFGGCNNSAAIGSEGEVIFIYRNSVKNSPKSPIAAVYLPDGEKASSVACCEGSVVVLSSNGRVFTSPIGSNGVLSFSIVSELSGQEIVCVSGTFQNCFAVSKEGRVFGCGSNYNGQLTLDFIIHFLRHEKVKSIHAGMATMANSFLAVDQATMFIHQQKRRSKMVPHSALQEIASAPFSLGVVHHQTHQTLELMNTSNSAIDLIKRICIFVIYIYKPRKINCNM